MAAAGASCVTFSKPLIFNIPSASSSSASFSASTFPLSFVRFGRNAVRVSAIATKWEPSKVLPQADRVLVRLEDLPEKSAGGVLLAKSPVKFERYLVGEVLSVGSEVTDVEAGKKVMFSDINAYEIDLGTDSRHCFCKAGDLLAVVE